MILVNVITSTTIFKCQFFSSPFFCLILQLKMMKLLELKQMHYQVNKYLIVIFRTLKQTEFINVK